MNALQIVQQAQDEMGLARSSTLTASDPTSRQFLALANSHGFDLMKRHTWTALQLQTTISTVSGTYDYTLASDFDRFIDDTQWDRTNFWQLVGPISPQIDRFRRDGLGVNLGPRRAFRLLGTTVRINPTPAVDGDVLGYEYISNKWAANYGGSTKAAITADTDNVAFDPWLMIRGIKYRYRHAKGYEAESFKDEHDTHFDICKAADIGVGTLSMSPQADPLFLTIDNFPDTFGL